MNLSGVNPCCPIRSLALAAPDQPVPETEASSDVQQTDLLLPPLPEMKIAPFALFYQYCYVPGKDVGVMEPFSADIIPLKQFKEKIDTQIRQVFERLKLQQISLLNWGLEMNRLEHLNKLLKKCVKAPACMQKPPFYLSLIQESRGGQYKNENRPEIERASASSPEEIAQLQQEDQKYRARKAAEAAG